MAEYMPWVALKGEFRRTKDSREVLYHQVRRGVEPELRGIRGVMVQGEIGVDGRLICERVNQSEVIPVDKKYNLAILDRIVYNPPTDDEKL